MEWEQMKDRTKGKKILFLTTKNLSYIRNAQEIAFFRQYGKECRVVGSESRHYPVRVLKTWLWGLIQLARFRPQVIVAGFAPQLLLPFLWLGRRLRREVWIDFFISLWDTLVDDRKRLRPESLGARFFYWLDRKTLSLADLYLTDTQADREYFAQALGARRDRGVVWYLQADTSLYFPRMQKKPEEWKDRFVVLYFGSILPLQGVETVLEAVGLLRQEERIQFLLIGPLGKIPEAEKIQGQKNVVCHTWLPQETLAENISMADLCLAGHFNKEIGKARRTIPGKAYIYKAMGKPMILGDSPANHELYPADGKTIYYVPQGDAAALAAQIRSLAQEGGYIS